MGDQVRMRGILYSREVLERHLPWMRSRMEGATAWEKKFLTEQITRVELALRTGEAA